MLQKVRRLLKVADVFLLCTLCILFWLLTFVSSLSSLTILFVLFFILCPAILPLSLTSFMCVPTLGGNSVLSPLHAYHLLCSFPLGLPRPFLTCLLHFKLLSYCASFLAAFPSFVVSFLHSSFSLLLAVVRCLPLAWLYCMFDLFIFLIELLFQPLFVSKYCVSFCSLLVCFHPYSLLVFMSLLSSFDPCASSILFLRLGVQSYSPACECGVLAVHLTHQQHRFLHVTFC